MQSPASEVVRTDRGLAIAGTRTTLYSVIDYLQADWPPELIRHWLNLSDQQLTAALTYIDAHRDEVEAEYRVVLRQAQEKRRYWEKRKSHHFASSIAEPQPAKKKLRAKLLAWKDQLGIT